MFIGYKIRSDGVTSKSDFEEKSMVKYRKIFFTVTHICSIFLILVSISVPALSENEENESSINITAEVAKPQVNVGDRIKLKLIAEKADGYDVLFPETLNETGDFSFIEARPVKNSFGRVIKTEKEYILTIFDTGIHVISPVNVKYKKKMSTDWQVAFSPQVPMDVKSLLTENDTDIKALKGLVYVRTNRIYFILGAVLIILILVGGWIFFKSNKMREKQSPKEIKKSAHEIAYEELKLLSLMNLPEQGLIKEYYSRLSDIVRHYIENRFSLRAPEMTTEEFLYAVKSFPVVGTEHKELLKIFLSQCDMVKFAKYGPTRLEMIDSFNTAENFINQTKLVEQEEARK
ncbi:MAG: hypothetical protein ABIH85_02830 [Candidatus Omnitrophota bacterium]|nr:hypothetical protein [Candidatus Omnitrophota bacterium]